MEGVVLAAGSSSRAGAFKPGLLLGGKPVILRCIEGMAEVCARIVVVGGFRIDRLRELLDGVPGVECIENPGYHSGMFSSVQTGLAQVRAGRCFLLPADIPLVPAEVYHTLATYNAPIVIPAFRGVRGHPVLLSAELIPAILRAPDTSSLREFTHGTEALVVEVDTDRILLDLDTPGDHRNLATRLSSPGGATRRG